jgi:Domain of unknown function (DUF4403)
MKPAISRRLALYVGADTSLVLALACCQKVPDTAPPRATNAISIPAQTSRIAVPVSVDLNELAQALERAVPRHLWQIDKPGQVCVASKRIKVLFAKIKTPTVKCRIVGLVTRSTMSLSGEGQDLIVSMPLHATVSARDIGGILKQETAHADAEMGARVRLSIATDWSLHGKVAIDYHWTTAPHVDFLGHRIDLTGKADAKLQGVIAKLEQTLPHELEKLQVHERIAGAWNSAFTSLELNRADPPVWMRITPRELNYGGYTIHERSLALKLGMSALTETFVGPRPTDPLSTPLPAMKSLKERPGQIVFAIPVIADYPQLEPVLLKALTKRSRRPFEIPGVGPVNAQFSKVTAYGTDNGKIAVGLAFTAAKPGGNPSHGTVWLTGQPINSPNSQRVAFTQLNVAGVTDSTGTSLLLKLANAPGLSTIVADALTQNFTKDYDDLLGKITRAIAERRTGRFVISAHITDVKTGQLEAAGQGIYLPVWGKGTASIVLDHQKPAVPFETANNRNGEDH